MALEKINLFVMREFGKSKRKPWWKKILHFLGSFISVSETFSSRGHHDRMQSRKRKTKFDK